MKACEVSTLAYKMFDMDTVTRKVLKYLFSKYNTISMKTNY